MGLPQGTRFSLPSEICPDLTVRTQILTPDFLLGYATRSETLAPPTDARTADLSSSVLSSDVFFQYENGTDVSIHMLYARGTPSALFEGEQMVRQWAEKTCNTAEATWGLELSLAEGHFEDDCGLIDAETGMSSGRPVASNVLQLAASEDGRFTANVLNVLKLVAGDGVESGAEPLSANSDPVLCSFSVPSSHKDEDIKSEDDASSETPRVALALHLRLVRLDPLGASSARRRCEAVTLVSDDICEGVEFGTLRLEFSLQKDNDDKMHVVLSGASCTDPAQLVSSTLIVSPAGSSSRLGIFPRARIQHFYEACARLLVSVRTGEKLLWDDYMLEWLGKANSAPTSFAEINRLLEDRIDVAIVERLGLRRMALERRVKKLARELAEVAKEHPELGIDAVVVAKEYWETNAGEDLRVELKNWEPSEIAASLVEEKRRGLAKRKNDELAAQAAAQVIKFSSAPAVPRNALKERNAFAPPRTIPDGKEPARKRSRLSVDAENAPPARA